MKIPRGAKVAKVYYSGLKALPMISGPVCEHDRKVIQAAFDRNGFDMKKPIVNGGYEKKTHSHVFWQVK